MICCRRRRLFCVMDEVDQRLILRFVVIVRTYLVYELPFKTDNNIWSFNGWTDTQTHTRTCYTYVQSSIVRIGRGDKPPNSVIARSQKSIILNSVNLGRLLNKGLG